MQENVLEADDVPHVKVAITVLIATVVVLAEFVFLRQFLVSNRNLFQPSLFNVLQKQKKESVAAGRPNQMVIAGNMEANNTDDPDLTLSNNTA